MRKLIPILVVLMIFSATLLAEAQEIEIDNVVPEEEYLVYGHELIEIGEHINNLHLKVEKLEEQNDLLKERLKIERKSHDQAIEKANELIEKQEGYINSLQEYNRNLKRNDYLNRLLFFTAGLGVSQF
ncbi:hypothetical protein MWH25_01500 [Natroniella acetigena]|uniref:hypothetical protein n=1 Tax=Natroniella acetigena TaxID=52004 RepID=UPI002009F11C|nr:hypothetical protein [Natroniella acetigena]MCK8826423.1 hypothetical protein [Natroniella acetigena]